MIRWKSALLAVALWPAAALGWDLDRAASSLSVVSVKNGDIEETHRFTDLSGLVGGNGMAMVAIGLGSIDTGIEIRDERMRTMLFDLPSHPFALVSTRIDLQALETTPVGGKAEVGAPLLIEANGARIETEATLIVERLGPDRAAISTAAPIPVDALALGFGPGIEALRDIAGLDAIAPTVPVSASLVFVR